MAMSRSLALAALIAPLVLALAACAPTVKAPTDTGVCYSLGAVTDGKAKFNVVATGVPDMEHCAAQLEAMRIRFLQLGGTNNEITGAYQGNFLFLQREGVFTSERYEGARFPFLVRTGDGRLAVPGSVEAGQ
jgi:hypothetical protein